MPVTINGGYVMRAWYDIVAAELDKRADEAGAAQPALIEELIADQRSNGIAADRILLAGFSQGGDRLANRIATQGEAAGIMALSTYLACADLLGLKHRGQPADSPCSWCTAQWIR